MLFSHNLQGVAPFDQGGQSSVLFYKSSWPFGRWAVGSAENPPSKNGERPGIRDILSDDNRDGVWHTEAERSHSRGGMRSAIF